MRRFLLFPPLVAVWLVLAQGIITALSSLGTWLIFRVVSSTTDVYLVTSTNPWTQILQFLPAVVIGVTMGCLFAAADMSFHPTRLTKESTRCLTRNLLKSGAVVAILILLCQGVLLIMANQQAHRRYHAYPPDMIWLNWIGLIQPFLVFAALLWALRATFKAKPTQP